MSNDTNDNYFEAGNIYLATYLLSQGFSLRGLSGYNRSKRVLFDNTHDVRDAAQRYFKGSEASKLFHCYRQVKDFIFQNGV